MAVVEKSKTVERSSLAGPRFSPLRGVLKLIVEADGSRLTLSRLRAVIILLSALSAFAFLGYMLPAYLF